MTEIDQAIRDGVVDILNSMTHDERENLFSHIDTTFRLHTRKKITADSELMIEKFSEKIKKLVMSLRFGVDSYGQIVLVPYGFENHTTLEYLTRGSEWFEGRDVGNDVLNFVCKPSS